MKRLALLALLVSSTVRAAPSVVVHLQMLAPSPTVSFGLPVPSGAVRDVRAVAVHDGAKIVPARVTQLLADYDATGAASGIRAVLIQFPTAAISLGKAGAQHDVTVTWSGGVAATAERVPYSDLSFESTESARVAERTIVDRGGATLVETAITQKPLFTSREPRVLATFPAGYLAETRILGAQVDRHDAARRGVAALQLISDGLDNFAGSAIYDEAYPLNPDPESVADPKTNYEGWLYDRCATFLLAYTHTGEERFLRHGLRACAWYDGAIVPTGWRAGYFIGKPDPDIKYSHLRGLYAYYALTGDQSVLPAVRAIAERWYNDPTFVVPYRAGHVRGRDHLWTERLLADALEAMIYGHRLTGDVRYFTAAKELFETAYRHITGDARVLAEVNPGVPFPPQNCFIHSALQHGEGPAETPWCSAWMSELLVDPLLRLQEETKDRRVDEVFIRLTRFLRDVGTSYFHGNPLTDNFLHPAWCDDPADQDDRRHLVPLYGVGLDAAGKIRRSGEFEDEQHCLDGSALVAAGMRALKHAGGFDRRTPELAPFATEGESFTQLEQELLFCADRVLFAQTRPARAPSHWKSGDLAAGLANPAAFIKSNKIGFPLHAQAPARRLSWWFNTALEEFSLLHDAGLRVDQLTPARFRERCSR